MDKGKKIKIKFYDPNNINELEIEVKAVEYASNPIHIDIDAWISCVYAVMGWELNPNDSQSSRLGKIAIELFGRSK